MLHLGLRSPVKSHENRKSRSTFYRRLSQRQSIKRGCKSTDDPDKHASVVSNNNDNTSPNPSIIAFSLHVYFKSTNGLAGSFCASGTLAIALELLPPKRPNNRRQGRVKVTRKQVHFIQFKRVRRKIKTGSKKNSSVLKLQKTTYNRIAFKSYRFDPSLQPSLNTRDKRSRSLTCPSCHSLGNEIPRTI